MTTTLLQMIKKSDERAEAARQRHLRRKREQQQPAPSMGHDSAMAMGLEESFNE